MNPMLNAFGLLRRWRSRRAVCLFGPGAGDNCHNDHDRGSPSSAAITLHYGGGRRPTRIAVRVIDEHDESGTYE